MEVPEVELVEAKVVVEAEVMAPGTVWNLAHIQRAHAPRALALPSPQCKGGVAGTRAAHQQGKSATDIHANTAPISNAPCAS